MTEDRRKEIALMIVEEMTIERGIPAPNVMKRDVGNQAQKLQIETGELMDFYQSFVPKILGRTFGYTKVALNMSGSIKKFEIQG